MKFTIALTFFAAASALELKEDDSGFMDAIDTAYTGMSEGDLKCVYGEIAKMLDDVDDIDITWDDAVELEEEVA